MALQKDTEASRVSTVSGVVLPYANRSPLFEIILQVVDYIFLSLTLCSFRSDDCVTPIVVISRSSIFFSASCRFNPKTSNFLSMETIVAWIRSRLPEISAAGLVKELDNAWRTGTTALDIAKPKAGKPFQGCKPHVTMLPKPSLILIYSRAY